MFEESLIVFFNFSFFFNSVDWGGIINNYFNIEDLTLSAMIKIDENGIISVTEVRAEVEVEVERDAKKDTIAGNGPTRANAPKFKVMFNPSNGPKYMIE